MSSADLANRLAKLVEAAGSQRKFGDLVDVTHPAVNGWLKGSRPYPRVLAKIAEVTGVSVDWLLEGIGDERKELARFRARLKQTYEGMDQPAGQMLVNTSGEYSDFLYGARAKLKAARESAGLTFAALAKKVGNCPAGYLQALEERGVQISERVAQRLCKVLPPLELDDLLGGSDAPIIRGNGVGTMGTGSTTVATGGLVARKVPVISMAQAGDLTTWEDIYDYEGVETYSVKDPKAIAVRIRGDSMMPDYKEGTVAILYPSVPVRTEHLVVAKLRDGSVLFKRLHMADGQYRFISSNPKYPPINARKEQIEWIYPVGKTERDEL